MTDNYEFTGLIYDNNDYQKAYNKVVELNSSNSEISYHIAFGNKEDFGNEPCNDLPF